jgi:hypothetical protein
MKWAPIADLRFKPFVLPVFDDSWKAQCRTCAHVGVFSRSENTKREHTLMHCGATGPRHPNHPLHCIDARDEAGPCGPSARLYRCAETK